jgi:uncharacterized SAM-dependent methyltransferase
MVLTKRQEAELVTAIQGRGEIPLKFAYLGEGAWNWDRIAKERSAGEGINSAETILLTKRVEDFLATIKSEKGVNVIDIGCGNATPVFPILNKLKENKIKFTYAPLDISQKMLDIAVSTVSKKFPGTECTPILMDFELGQFSDVMYDLKKNGFNNLMLFLGSTLGNHSDMNRVLSNFRDSMTSREYLILGVELTNLAKVSRLFPHYENEGIEKLITFIATEIGIPRKAYKVEISWNIRHSQIEGRAIFNQDVKVEIAQEKFTIYKNENILLLRSIKFTESSIAKLLSDVGFRTELLTTAEDRGFLLSMIQPTRYSV